MSRSSLSQKVAGRVLRALPDRVTRRVLASLPGEARLSAHHAVARARFRQFMRARLGHFMVDVDPGPMAPKEIVMRTAVLDEKDATIKLNPDFYFESGYTQMLALLQTAERFGLNLRTVGAVFELGCGSARLLRHLRCMDGVRLVGADLSEEMMAWCRENIPGAEFHSNGYQPPLAFAKENTYDLAFAASVFTHIPLETQQQWIREIHRILRPGGLFLCDVLGRNHQELMLSAEEKARLRTEGTLVLTATDERASLSTKIHKSWDVFQTRSEFLKAFGSVFTVLDYLPTSIDLLILQKPR